MDGAKKFEVAVNKSLREGYKSRDDEGRCSYPRRQSTVLGRALHSWDSHTEEDLENILLDGHAIVTSMEITPDLQHYSSGVYFSPECQHWRLESSEVTDFVGSERTSRLPFVELPHQEYPSHLQI